MKLVLQKTSLVDFPGKLCSVFFFTGCNLRCPWCHNRDLVTDSGDLEKISLEEAFSHLEKRASVLRAVVLSGGEPSIQNELPEITAKIKKTGLLVKLDTNGINPDMLEKLFSSDDTKPDYIALDLKIAPPRYNELASAKNKNLGELIAKSAALIKESGIPHEYRSLVLPENYFSEADIEELVPLTDNDPWYFRAYTPGTCLDEQWNSYTKPPETEVQRLAEFARKLGKNAVTPD